MSDHNSDDLNAKPAGPAADHLDASAQSPKQPLAGAQDAAKLESPGLVPGQSQPSETPKVEATSASDAAAPRSTGRIMDLRQGTCLPGDRRSEYGTDGNVLR